MSVNVNYKIKLGQYTLIQGENEFTIDLHPMNGLVAMIWHGEKNDKLVFFIADNDHAKNIVKNCTNKPLGEIKDLWIDGTAKDGLNIAKWLFKMGYDVKLKH